MQLPDFKPFPKVARLSREIIITEKLDGTNAQVFITEDGDLFAGSRTRWITPQDDNYGFAQWVESHRDELLTLGPGQHFGEWWGKGINRNYGLNERRFSLFNVRRWALYGTSPKTYPTLDPRITKVQDILPTCCGLVPVLYEGPFNTYEVETELICLREIGSHAAPGFMKPEGVVVFHTAANMCFKKTIEKDEQPKGSKMEPRFIAWSTDLGQTEEFGSTKITGVFYDAQTAAEYWASKRDTESAEYTIAWKGESGYVTVKDCVTGDITEWEVTGDCEPVYYAHDITSNRKVDDEH